MVQGDIVTLASPITGNLATWDIKEGDTYNQNQTIGSVGTVDAKSLIAPIQGTLFESDVVKGQNVTQGETLARFVNLNQLYVVANIEETSINDISVGKDVDITIDAFPGNTYKGTVVQVGMATSSAFNLLPTPNTSGTFTKVTQRIPVKISLTNYNKGIIPGLNVTVQIHK